MLHDPPNIRKTRRVYLYRDSGCNRDGERLHDRSSYGTRNRAAFGISRARFRNAASSRACISTVILLTLIVQPRRQDVERLHSDGHAAASDRGGQKGQQYRPVWKYLREIKDATPRRAAPFGLLTSNERSQSDANPKVVSCVAEPTNTRGMFAFHPRYRAVTPPSFHRNLNASHEPE